MVRLDVTVKPRRPVAKFYPPGLAGGYQQIEVAVNRGQTYPRNLSADRFVHRISFGMAVAGAKDLKDYFSLAGHPNANSFCRAAIHNDSRYQY